MNPDVARSFAMVVRRRLSRPPESPPSRTLTLAHSCCVAARQMKRTKGPRISLVFLLQPHTACVVTLRSRPVTEDSEDADLPSQDVERHHDVTIVVERIEGRLEVER